MCELDDLRTQPQPGDQLAQAKDPFQAFERFTRMFHGALELEVEDLREKLGLPSQVRDREADGLDGVHAGARLLRHEGQETSEYL